MPSGIYERSPKINKGHACRVPECERPSFCRYVCKMHYRRWKSQYDRLFAWVEMGDPDDCWVWKGKNRSDSRPCIMWRDIVTRKESKVHAMRALMLVIEGPLFTTNLEAAHSCHNKQCVNPDHGEWATHAENMAMSRGENYWRKNGLIQV